jgi:uroporphyrinogen-III synthase
LAGARNSDANIREPLPLAGRRLLITRAAHQTSELADRLAALGATIDLIPTIEIVPPASFAALDHALTHLESFDIVAFTSANAVRAFHVRSQTLGIAANPKRIAVVGPATARSVEAIGLRVDTMPSTYTAESLAKLLSADAPGHSVLLVLAEGAPTTLANALTHDGALVAVAAAYANRIPQASLPAIKDLFANAATLPHAATFTSASTATNLLALLDAAGFSLPESVARISIGPITSRALRTLGLPSHAEAMESTIDALVAAVIAHLHTAA